MEFTGHPDAVEVVAPDPPVVVSVPPDYPVILAPPPEPPGVDVLPVPGPAGRKGKDGSDITPEQMNQLAGIATEHALESIGHSPTIDYAVIFRNALV